ncbi:Uncharacterised protein [Escherichia coli]|uniref:Uncharacterized protein n=1 Tax=Escherichia coli TaxID=562 RepID=A0A376WDX5_ECOLX|nr:Uncharacterised protein [Escherichia coli]
MLRLQNIAQAITQQIKGQTAIKIIAAGSGGQSTIDQK